MRNVMYISLLPCLLACSTLSPKVTAAAPVAAAQGIAALQTAVPTGKSVTVVGVYRKWSGNCKGQPPVSRGDWMLSDEHGCIYVHGQLPALKVGKPLTVEGQLKLAPDNRRYLELEKVQF